MGDLQDAKRLERLLPQVRARDEAAARELVEALYPVVARVVRAHLPRRDDPEDLMQEVFLKMFSKLDQFRGAVPFEHWVSRIALTTCFDHFRRQRARPELRWADLPEEQQTVLETVSGGEEPADADAPQAMALLGRLLDQLPQLDAWLIREVDLKERSLADVCSETGWNGGAARVRLFRARRRLQALYNKLDKQRLR